jgi:hypothetical protein
MAREPADKAKIEALGSLICVSGACWASHQRDAPRRSNVTLLRIFSSATTKSFGEILRKHSPCRDEEGPDEALQHRGRVYLAPFGEDAGHFSLHSPDTVRKLNDVGNSQQIFQFHMCDRPARRGQQYVGGLSVTKFGMVGARNDPHRSRKDCVWYWPKRTALPIRAKSFPRMKATDLKTNPYWSDLVLWGRLPVTRSAPAGGALRSTFRVNGAGGLNADIDSHSGTQLRSKGPMFSC